MKPGRLRPGARIGVVAPSSPVDRKRDFRSGLANLAKMGYEIVVSDGVFSEWMHMAGTDEHRAATINRMFADPSIDGIVCARGGAGAARILEMLDYELIRKNPKPFIGFSDITALHFALWSKCRLICFSGATVEKGWHRPGRRARATFEALLMRGDKPKWTFRPSEVRTVCAGSAEGRLIGGNLAVLCGLIGSQYMKIGSDTILFLEDVDEGPERVDRMLTQFRLAGLLDRVNGVVFGKFTGTGATRLSRSRIREVIDDHFKRSGIPVVMDLPFGHIADMLTIPIGVRARLDTKTRTLRFLERAVR